MTSKQVQQFNFMLFTLKRIAVAYASPDKLRANAEKKYGLSPEEAIEYAYDNVRSDALQACKGVKMLKGGE